MSRRLLIEAERWPLARPFAIARGTKVAAEVVVATIEEDGRCGRGECVPYPRYGETTAGVVAALRALAPEIAAGLDRDRLVQQVPPGAARNALDCALVDLACRQAGVPAWQLLGLPAPVPVMTAETIALASPEEMATEAARLADRPCLKLKIAADGIVERVAAVRRAAPLARLIVDANEAWTAGILRDVLPALAELGVTMIEQPLPAGADAALRDLTSPIPICADEACHTRADLSRLAAGYSIINVKLDKAGGLGEALALIEAARRRGLGVMVGCIVATSLAMAPALLLAGLADVVDLDGPLWLATDRAPSLTFERGFVYPPAAGLWGSGAA
jgi:L-alanine-DL-glutamate epimerase-like enolase superfamily enzyme